MKRQALTALLLFPALGLAPTAAHAQSGTAGSDGAGEPSFDQASAALRQQLDEAVAELDALRQRIAAEQVPLNRELNEEEAELSRLRGELQRSSRLLDSRTLDLSNLRTDIKARRDEVSYVSNLLGEYLRNFESRLHVAELQRYARPLEEARLAPENTNLSEVQVFEAQAALVDTAFDRLEEALDGTRFEGTAVDAGGLVNHGTFVLVGPAALFRSADGSQVGTAEQRLGSLEPAQIAFADPADRAAAEQLITTGAGTFPFDPTLGSAHEIEATHESLWEHVQKGGPVMVPIFAMAAAALLVALTKWITLAFLGKPSGKQIRSLLGAIGEGDGERAGREALQMPGPLGRMLVAGVQHLGEPRDLIEEVMYEEVLTTRLKLQRMLPFVAICAASAPLLGLLGTVTGIINTFKLITVFGSGDVKTLSGGISEALITTEFGLIVAIPSLLLHAFLSRKARGITGLMESVAVSFMNRMPRTAEEPVPVVPAAREESRPRPVEADPERLRAQVQEVLSDLLVPRVQQGLEKGRPDPATHAR